jgi:hypothetical protein
MFGILDPTIATARETIPYVPRPKSLEGLRLGVIENTRKNSQALLLMLAKRLESAYGIGMEVLLHKHQRAPLSDAQLAALKGNTDFAIAGIGD